MKKRFTKTALGLGMLFAAGSALADLITLNQTIHLPSPVDFYLGRAVFTNYALFPDSLIIRQGDTIDLTLNFAPGQSIRMGSTGGEQAFAMDIYQDNNRNTPNTSNFTLSDISFNLIGAQGSFPASVNMASLAGGHTSLFINPHGHFLAAGQEATFTGMHARYTVSQLQNGQSYYFGTSLYAYADRLEVHAAPVPEAETWAMLLGGLGLLAVMRRRRSSTLR